MPLVQFGTYKMKGSDCYSAVAAALHAGYRGLDTASVYDNEKEVGQAVKDSGLQRDQVFIQTKLWRSFVGIYGLFTKEQENHPVTCDTNQFT